MKRIWLGVGATLIVLAYLGGFWPQHQQLTASQALVGTLQNQLAATLSAAYFDAVRVEASRAIASAICSTYSRLSG